MIEKISQSPPYDSTNYLVFEEYLETAPKHSPWLGGYYIKVHPSEADESSNADVFTDEERSDIILAYTPQELRIRIMNMISSQYRRQELTEEKSRRIVEDMFLEAEEYGIITDHHSKGTRIIYGKQFISSFLWLAEQSLLEDQPDNSSRFGKWLRKPVTERADATLDTVKGTLGNDAELNFANQKVLSEHSSDRVWYVFMPSSLEIKHFKNMDRKSGPKNIYERAETWGAKLAVNALNRYFSLSYSRLDHIRHYTTEVLRFNVANPLIDSVYAPTLGELVTKVLKTSIKNPGDFITEHIVGFTEFQELEFYYEYSKKARAVYDERVISFLEYAASIHDVKDMREDTGHITERDKAIAKLASIGGNGPFRDISLIVSRELNANSDTPVETIEQISHELSAMNHALLRSAGNDRVLESIIDQVNVLLSVNGIHFDSGIFDRLLHED